MIRAVKVSGSRHSTFLPILLTFLIKLSTFWARSLSRVARFSYYCGGCFLASMPGSFVLSRQKTQIEAIRLFRVYTNLDTVAISEKCHFFGHFSLIATRTSGKKEVRRLKTRFFPDMQSVDLLHDHSAQFSLALLARQNTGLDRKGAT